MISGFFPKFFGLKIFKIFCSDVFFGVGHFLGPSNFSKSKNNTDYSNW